MFGRKKRVKRKKSFVQEERKDGNKEKRKEEKKKKKNYEFDIDKRTKNGKCTTTGVLEKLLESIYGDTESADIIVKFHARDFFCHSLILFQNGSFFKRFNDEKKYKIREKDQKKVFDSDEFGFSLKASEFECILKYMYKGFFGIPESGTELRWLEIARYYDLKGIREMLLFYFGTYLTPGDAVRIVDKALESNEKFLYSACLTLIEVFDEIIFKKTSAYLDFGLKTMIYFAKKGRVSITEVDIFNCLMNYCEKKYETYKFKNAHEMYKKNFEEFIRYPLMDPDVFCKEIDMKYPNLISQKYVIESYKYNSDEKIQKKMESFRTTPRGFPPCNKFKGSEILKPEMQNALMKMFLEAKPKKKNWHLQYRATKDGMIGSVFHAKCDNKGPSMTIIESQCNCIFGGFANLSWQSNSAYRVDHDAFLFSLVRGGNFDPFKCTSKSSSTHHVYHNQSYGPTFGGNHDIFVPGNMSTSTGYTNVGHSYDRPPGKSQYLSMTNSYRVKEIEVFILK